MTEPIPSAASPEQPSLPTNAEDRKAAAALSALHANDISAEGEDGAGNEAGGAGGVVGAGGKLPSAADQEALGKAMSQLEIVAGGKKTGAAKKKEQQEEEEAAAAAAAAEAKRRKAIKVSAEDVGLLVDELDLTKPKATELLKSHEGDPIRAIRAFIAPPTVTAA